MPLDISYATVYACFLASIRIYAERVVSKGRDTIKYLFSSEVLIYL